VPALRDAAKGRGTRLWCRLRRRARRLRIWLWATPLNRLHGWRRVGVHLLRLLHMVLRELTAGDLSQRAASLVFTTLLALVPLLAVSFSVLKGFGVHNRVEVLLFNLLAPLGSQGQQFAARIVSAVDKVEVGVLGGLGLLILLVTVVGLVRKLELALNHSWRVHRPRRFVQRFSSYVSVLLVGPVLVVAALATEIVQKFAETGPLGQFAGVIPAVLPYLLVLVAFVFAYQFLPATRVGLRSALLGGAVGSALWAAAGWAFAAFVVNPPSSSYTAIYSSFAVVFFFILWLYVAWLILLIGGLVAFYFQHPEYLGVMPGELTVSNRERERLALAVLVRVGRAHQEGETPPDRVTLVRAMALPAGLLDVTVETLIAGGFLARTAGGGLLPARDVGRVTLAEVLSQVRRQGDAGEERGIATSEETESTALLAELEGAAAAALDGRTLEQLILGDGGASASGTEGSERPAAH
jgi:membrane protein